MRRPSLHRSMLSTARGPLSELTERAVLHRDRAPLTSYSEEQAQLPNPPTALLDGTAHLAGLLTAVPQLVASGKEPRAADAR